MEKIGERLRRLRAATGLSQAKLAQAANVSQGTIGNIESGQRGYGESIVDIARALDVTPEYLRCESNDSSAPSSNRGGGAQVWVVRKDRKGTMPAELWAQGDRPAGAKAEFAEVATSDGQAFLFEVDDALMAPRYHLGEFALVEPQSEPDIEDDVLVRLTNGQIMLKRLLSRRGGWRLGSYSDKAVLFFAREDVSWVYYVAHPIPRRRVKVSE